MTTAETSMPWTDLMDKGREMGLMAMELVAITSTPTTGIDAVLENLEPHLAYQAKLEKDGVMFAAGPLSTTDGADWDGTGLFVYRAESLDAAVKLANQDPMHISGARTFEARTWMLNEGKVTIQVSYSRGTMRIE